MGKKVRFASPEWLAAVGEILPRLAAEHGSPQDHFSLCEVFTNAPPDLAQAGEIAWHFKIEGQSVEVAVGAHGGADATMRVDYEAVLPTARLVYTPEYLAERGDALPEGATLEGDLARMPAYITDLHNELALITA